MALALLLHVASGPTGVVLRGYDEQCRRASFLARRIPGADVDGRDMFLREDAADAYVEMLEAAAKDGVELRARSAFRTDAQQRRQHRKNPRLAVSVGLSTHQQGRSVDIESAAGRRGRSVFLWLRRRAGEFCFVQEVAYEPWHWQYRRDERCDALRGVER